MSAVNDVLGHLGLFSVNPDYMPRSTAMCPSCSAPT